MKLLFLFFPFILFSCTPQQVQTNPDQFKQLGQNILTPFKQQLMGTLMSKLEESTLDAVEACHTDAPNILESVTNANQKVEVDGQIYRVSLGRSSHKLRNIQNESKEWMDDYIKSFQGKKDLNVEDHAKVKIVNDKSFAYLEPIVVGPMCIACHGKDIDKDLLKVIDDKYPDDQARDFELGDFRGIFWVYFEQDK